MSQLRVLEPENSPNATRFTELGLRFCQKDQRWEKNGKTEAVRSLAAEVARLPGVKLQIKEGGKDESEPVLSGVDPENN